MKCALLLRGTSQCFGRQISLYASSTGRCISSLRGIFPPIVTPFNSNASFSSEKLKSNMEKWEMFPFSGYVVMGTNGESVMMTHSEKVSLIGQVSNQTDKTVIAGTGCETTDCTIQLTKDAASAGASAALVVTPSYYKGRMTSDALLHHYVKVADVSPIPVILYSVPANTGIDLDITVIVKLSTHPNIIGLKDSDGNITKLTSVVHNTLANNFQVLAGSASFLLPALLIGCVGGVCALANVLGGDVCRLYGTWQDGDVRRAADLQRRLVGPNTAITKTLGVAGLKYSMDQFGYYGGLPRLPLLPLSTDEKQLLKSVFEDDGFVPSQGWS